MWKVEKFLGCCNLERALVVLSWIGIVFGVLGIIGYTSLLVKLSSTDCSDEQVREYIKQMNLEQKDCDLYLTIASVGLVISIIFTIIGIIISYLFIRGVNKRNHRFIMPMMILYGIAVVLSGLSFFASLFSLHIPTIIYNLIYGVIVTYCFLCVYTVYDNIRHERFNNVQYHPK